MGELSNLSRGCSSKFTKWFSSQIILCILHTFLKECKARKPFFSELGLGSAFFPDLLIQYCVKTFFFLFHWQNIVYEVKYVVRVKIYWFCQLHFLVRVCWLQKLPTL